MQTSSLSAGRPRTGYGARLHVGAHLVVHALRRTPQRHLAQGGQVPLAKELVDGARRLLGNVDLSFPQADQQFVRRQIDDLDLGRLVDHVVGYGFTHHHARHLGHDIVQALQVLDVERRVHVNSPVQDLLHIQIAFGMA